MLSRYTLPGILVLHRELRTSASPYVHLTHFPAGLAPPKLSLNMGPRRRLIISPCYFSVRCFCLLGFIRYCISNGMPPAWQRSHSFDSTCMFFKIFQGPNWIQLVLGTKQLSPTANHHGHHIIFGSSQGWDMAIQSNVWIVLLWLVMILLSSSRSTSKEDVPMDLHHEEWTHTPLQRRCV